MSPVAGRSPEEVFAEMRVELDAGRTVKIGAPSYTHGALKDADGWYRLRELRVAPEAIDAFKRAHGRLTPGDLARLQEATGAIVLEAPTLDGLITAMREGRVRVL